MNQRVSAETNLLWTATREVFLQQEGLGTGSHLGCENHGVLNSQRRGTGVNIGMHVSHLNNQLGILEVFPGHSVLPGHQQFGLHI